MKRSPFSVRHPYWFVAFLEVAVILVYLLTGTIASVRGLSTLTLYGMANVGLTIISIILISVKRWWGFVGFRRPRRRSDLLYYVIPFLPLAINFVPGLEVAGLRSLLTILAITLMVGFAEEVIFRGAMVQALKTRGPWRAVIVTALLFGGTHALNVLAGRSAFDGAVQVFYAVAIGFGFAALVLKKGIIWPLVAAHFSIDFIQFLQRPGFAYSPAAEALISVGIGVVFTAYGLFVMLRAEAAGPDPLERGPVPGV